MLHTAANPKALQQIHIDVVRNATDDFNLFHDAEYWRRIRNNPFKGPIALGFQLESMIEHEFVRYRQSTNENELIDEYNLRFSNYQFSFVNAVKPGQVVDIDIKKPQFNPVGEGVLSHRVSVKADGKLALVGYKKESSAPLFLNNPESAQFNDLNRYKDRSFLTPSGFFLKRKFMNVSNAKNFLCGSLADQRLYFDDLTDTAIFPEIFPCSLISCALLEKAKMESLDFENSPMVYTTHKISIDRKVLSAISSNDALNILVRRVDDFDKTAQSADAESVQTYECYGLVEGGLILFRGLIGLTSLDSILKSIGGA